MKRSILVLGLSLVAAGTASATSTVTMLDDSSPDIGRYATLAIGADGLGLIAYYDLTDRDLEVAHCENVPCTSATLSTLDSGNIQSVSALVIGSDGRGLIAYYDSSLPGVKTAHCNDTACTSATIRTIDVTATGVPAMVIGTDGLPLMAYIHNFALRTVHCMVSDCSSRTVADVGSAPGTSGTAIAIGSDGLGVIAVARLVEGPVDVRRCLNVACTAAAPGPGAQTGPLVTVRPTAIAVPADGRALLAYEVLGPGSGDVYGRGSRCTTVGCAAQSPIFSTVTGADPDVTLQSNGLGWFAHGDDGLRIALRQCTDPSCASASVSCVNAETPFFLSLARGADGRSLVAFHRFNGGLGVAYDVSDVCEAPRMSVTDVTATELPGTQGAFVLTLTAPSARAITVQYASANGTAIAGQDYLSLAGTLTFDPGALSAAIPVSMLADGLDEPDETFTLSLSNAVGADIEDGLAVATIIDGDPTPAVSAGRCEVEEGSATTVCALPVGVEGLGNQTVTVGYATADGTATAGSDYVTASGTLTFPPGTPLRTIEVTVLGDTAIELHETFTLNLSNVSGGTILDGVGEGTILDDDAPSLSSLELTHGSRLTADLAAVPGPVADQDLYRLAQPGHSSWEIVADGVSGDVAPGLVVERLAEDNATVLQAGVPSGTGGARTLRWARRLPFAETHQHVRVRSTGCSTDCGTEDTYRLRVYETTARIPRFNNSGTQGTVLLIQNGTDGPVAANVDFWNAQGVLLATAPLALAPHAVGVLNTLSLPALVGRSGSVTITHDGPYGALAGKSVALEPATGFSFDSPLTYKPR